MDGFIEGRRNACSLGSKIAQGASLGNFGDIKTVGDGVFEKRDIAAVKALAADLEE